MKLPNFKQNGQNLQRTASWREKIQLIELVCSETTNIISNSFITNLAWISLSLNLKENWMEADNKVSIVIGD